MKNIEIERKYLVNNLPDNLDSYPSKDITQAYIDMEPEVRIRKLGDDYFLTKKSDGTIKREEIEVSITKQEYEEYLLTIINNKIEKTRYYIPVNAALAELDIYVGVLEGLKVVEVEFDSMEDAEKFIEPDWFGQEVTDDKKYKNKNLSMLTVEEIENLLSENKKYVK